MEFGSQRSSNLLKTKAVEQCFCPTGYEGLSCESCSYGYTRNDMNYILAHPTKFKIHSVWIIRATF